MDIYVKPAAGRLVRDPVSKRPLPEKGAWVTKNAFWTRRVKDGDVSVTQPPAAEAKAATPAAPQTATPAATPAVTPAAKEKE